MKNSGVIQSNDGDEKKVKYDPKMRLLERLFSDKFLTHLLEVPRVLQFVIARLTLVRKGYINTASSFHHCVL